jgi:hypothetical protein
MISPNVSTTPLRQWGFRQCLPFSWTTLRGKHCRHPIAVMGVVDTFGLTWLVTCQNLHFGFSNFSVQYYFKGPIISRIHLGLRNTIWWKKKDVQFFVFWTMEKNVWYSLLLVWISVVKTTVEKHSNGTTAPSEGTWPHCGLWYRTYGTHHYHQLAPGTTRVIYEFPLCGKVTGSHLTAIGCLRAPTPLRQVLTVKNCTRWKSGKASYSRAIGRSEIRG